VICELPIGTPADIGHTSVDNIDELVPDLLYGGQANALAVSRASSRPFDDVIRDGSSTFTAKTQRRERFNTTVPMHIEEVGFEVVDSATTVHRALGPGLLESSYKECLAYELVETEVDVPVIYDGVRKKTRYRIDMIAEGLVIVESKAVSRVLEIHDAQLLTHLKHRNLKLGFRINLHEVRLKDGTRRMVNGL
jgi:GxxExxY protein